MTQVQGMAEFKRRWGAIPVVVRKSVAAEMESIAENLVQDMRKIAPKRTGKGSSSINWTWGDAPKGAMVIGKVAGNEYRTLRITIYAAGDDAFYMKFQEWGTVNMPANPFFFPVWRARRRSARTRITRAINKAIRSV